MGGMEPGRARIEEREVGSIWSGTRVLLDHGVEWIVRDIVPAGSAYNEPKGTYIMHLERDVDGEPKTLRRPVQLLELMRCRVDKS
jgi:hypothetical protein